MRSLLAQHGLWPRKALGQHFLVDRAALLTIAESARLTLDDLVVEIGPGAGALTRELLARVGRVVAVEKDSGMARLLREELGGDPRLTVIEADALDVAPEGLLPSPLARYKVVANLPYYVASLILRKFLESKAKPQTMVLLLQREVAESVVAAPGSMTLLSVAVQYYATPVIIGVLRPDSFYPPPKVDSAIVRLEVRPSPPVEVPTGWFFEVVRAGFSSPRQQLANPLSRGLGMDKRYAQDALRRAGIAPLRRPESLSLPEWGALCGALREEPADASGHQSAGEARD